MAVVRLASLDDGAAYVEVEGTYDQATDSWRLDSLNGVNNTDRDVTVTAQRGAVARSRTMPAGTSNTIDLTDLTVVQRRNITVGMA